MRGNKNKVTRLSDSNFINTQNRNNLCLNRDESNQPDNRVQNVICKSKWSKGVLTGGVTQKCPKACLKTAHTLQPVTHYAINHLMLLSIEERAMSRKPLSEKELLEGITPKTAHADELATTNEKDWGSYSEDTDKAESDFLVQRDDALNDTRMEKMLKMAERFNKSGSVDRETLMKVKGLTESEIPSENEYKMVLKRIETIFDAEPGTPEGDELEKLVTWVEAYEEEHYPF